MARLGFGVDIGGSGIKGATVDLEQGQLAADRIKVATPHPATPDRVSQAVAQVVHQCGWAGAVGAAFPAVITDGVARTAANVDQSWIGTDVETVLGEAMRLPVLAVNDADAAGLAEGRFGAARGHSGLVVVVTLGTGIGTALLHEGKLIANSELGHVELQGVDAETRASAAARERDRLSWERWAKRLEQYLRAIEAYLWPELFVLGGGVSRKPEKFLPFLELRTPVVPAALHNEAGIVGAAVLADERAPLTRA